MKRARNSVFIEICDEFNRRIDYRMVENRYFGPSKIITKEKFGALKHF